MTVFLISVLVFALAMLGLGLGVLAGRGAPRGSCGGLNRIPGLKGACGGCDRPCARGVGASEGEP